MADKTIIITDKEAQWVEAILLDDDRDGLLYLKGKQELKGVVSKPTMSISTYAPVKKTKIDN
jgi:hypothetical protein